MLSFLFAIFHVTISNYISLLDLELRSHLFCSFRATCTAHCNVLHFTILSPQISTLLCYNILNLQFFLHPMVSDTCNMPFVYGRAMAHVIRRQIPTAEDRVLSKENSCGLCGRQSGTRTCLSPSASPVPRQCYSTTAP